MFTVYVPVNFSSWLLAEVTVIKSNSFDNDSVADAWSASFSFFDKAARSSFLTHRRTSFTKVIALAVLTRGVNDGTVLGVVGVDMLINS